MAIPIKPFENYDFETANQAFGKLKTGLEDVAANRKFVKGDDWQDGSGWVGPQFTGASKLSRELKDAIAREFTSKSSVKSVVRRHRRGVIGRVPNWQISSRSAPSEPDAEIPKETTDLIAEAQKILNEFWKNSRVHRTLKEAVTDYLAAERSLLRLFFVQNGESEREVAKTVEDAAKMIHLFKEEPDAGCIIWNKETLKKASLFRYTREENVVIEMCYIDDDGDTIFKTFSKDDTETFTDSQFPTSLGKYNDGRKADQETDSIPLPLNGQLLVFELNGESFITPAMKSQQKLVNKAYTMLSHNLDVSGFRERVYLNAMPPGEIEIDPVTQKKTFKPNPEGIEVGAGKLSYTQGVPITEREGDKIKNTLTNPGVFESDPIPVTTYIETAAAGSEAILEEADQKHIAISGDATASGESRIQARDEYQGSLEDSKSELDDTMSGCFEAVLALVAYLMGSPDRYIDLQVTFNAILNPGPVSADQRRVTMEEAEKRFRSRESAMDGIGITDPDAMKSKIKEEEEENPPPAPPINPNEI